MARSFSGVVVIRYLLAVYGDVMSAHKPRLLDVATQLKHSAHAALGLAINCAQQSQANGRTGHGTTFWVLKVTSQVASTGTESAVYECLVFK